jgi:inorganic phosphate transporter, PiT family
VLTLPCAALIGAGTYGISRLFGTGALGPAIVAAIGVGLIAAAMVRRVRQGAPVPA